MRSRLLVLPVLALAALTAHGAPAGAATRVFALSDPHLDEVSGIAAGVVSPGVVYVHNDSGDSARFFALDASSGRVLATYNVPDADNVDWEDIAVAPDADGTPSVWLGDLGDNDRNRDAVTIYRVDEPDVDTSAAGQELTSGEPDVWRLRYPGAPADAESLAVSPAGVPYVVTKSYVGDSQVYAAPATPSAQPRTMMFVGAIRFGFTGTPGPYAPIGELMATGADLSREGTEFVVRTYTDAYLWQVADGDLAAALRSAPHRIALPRQQQGEAVCFAGGYLLIASEGRGTGVLRVAVPHPATPPPTSSAPPPPPESSPLTSPAALSRTKGRNGAMTYTLAGIAAAAIAAIGGLVLLHRRRS